MSAEAGITRTWRAGRYTVELSIPKPKPGTVASAVIEWSPHAPRNLTSQELRAYREGRNAALASLAAQLGGVIGLVEL